MRTDVSALYVDPRGPYPKLVADWWDEKRDARGYVGPNPVVAHPPCGPWGRLRHMYRGREHDCAPIAVEHVRRFGGALEHPARSLLWGHAGLPFPGELPDKFGGFTVELSQCEWGHVARKQTWVYLVGVSRAVVGAPPFPGREPTHWVSGGRGRVGKKAKMTPVPPGIKVCSAQQRRRTPVAFAEWLIELASQVAPFFWPANEHPCGANPHRNDIPPRGNGSGVSSADGGEP